MPASLFLEAKGRGEDLAVFAPSAAASSPWVFGLRFLFLIFVLISDLTFLPKFLQSRRTDVNLLVPSESLESLSVVSGFSELIILSTSALLVVLEEHHTAAGREDRALELAVTVVPVRRRASEGVHGRDVDVAAEGHEGVGPELVVQA